MSTVEEKSVAIIGGGLVGSLASLYLAQRGFHVKVFERRSDLRRDVHVEGNKSINLALSSRGILALKGVGIDEEVLATAIPMAARMIHPQDPNMPCHAQPYGDFGETINSVDRKLLNKMLLDKAEHQEGVELYFDYELVSMDPERGLVVVKDKYSCDCLLVGEHLFRLSEQIRNVYADFILGCDGAYSATRQEMMKRQPVDFAQHYVKHGYKELSILPDKQGAAKLPINYLHIWPREKFMLIALPNQDNSFTVTLFYPYEELLAIKTKDQILGLFQTHFPDALELIGKEALVKAFLGNPSAPLVTVKLSKYHYKDKLLLLGDAIHAMVPFYGQGMNAGFEDCRLFSELLDKAGTDDLGKVFEAFTAGRVADAHAICELALYNYLEMSTLVASKWFLAKRWLYSWLHWAAPSTFIPLYTMVSFSPHIAYSEAIRRRDRQECLVALAGGSLLGLASLALGFGLYRRLARSP